MWSLGKSRYFVYLASILLCGSFLLTENSLLPLVVRDWSRSKGQYSLTNITKTRKQAHPTKTTVLLFWRRRQMARAFSPFIAQTISRFGTGRIVYEVSIIKSEMDATTNSTQTSTSDSSRPCVIVSSFTEYEVVKRLFPSHCFWMMIGDEFCRESVGHVYDFRTYYKEANTAAAPLYVPLGPGYEFWAAHQQSSLNQTEMTAALRPTTFNAIFSVHTSPIRKGLEHILLQMNRTKYSSEVNINPRRSKNASTPDAYDQILRNSIFTLSPFGHNPECFRFFEAIEAGSIPVLSTQGLNKHPCKNALDPILDAPVVWLSSWEEWPSRLEELMSDIPSLVRQQLAVQQWYTQFMRDAVLAFENRLLMNLG